MIRVSLQEKKSHKEKSLNHGGSSEGREGRTASHERQRKEYQDKR